jgi:hypothetical protein
MQEPAENINIYSRIFIEGGKIFLIPFRFYPTAYRAATGQLKITTESAVELANIYYTSNQFCRTIRASFMTPC